MRIMLVSLVLIVSLTAAAQGQQSLLLTDNGLGNAAATAYANVARQETKGYYDASPPLAVPETKSARTDFATGALTDGNASFSSVKPSPYAYWTKVQQGELVFHLGRNFQLDKVRVCLLNKAPHGTGKLDVFVTGDPLEFPDVLKVATVTEPQDGWNEVPVNRVADGIRIVFRAMEGRGYITASEVEIWGRPVAEGAAPAPAAAPGDPKHLTDGIAWWAFDFGPADSPAFSGFGACDSHCVYSKQRGYGWIPYKDGVEASPSNFGPASNQVPGLGERDRSEKRGGMDSIYRDFVMTSAYYHTQVRQTFALDVPNGTYRVMTLHGDQTYGRPGKQTFWIETEGKVAVPEVVLPSSLMGYTVHTTTVTDGRLDVTLDAKSDEPANRGFILNALLVVSANTPQEQAFADKRVQMVQAAVERERLAEFNANFKEVPYVETATMVTPTEADRKRGFIAWTPQWMSLIYPNSVPTTELLQKPFAAFATPGEYEPVVVALRALQPLKQVKLSAGALTGPGGASIPASAIDVRVVRCWRQRLGSSWSKEWRVMPELLEALPSFDLAADTTREFWLTVKVPEQTKPGMYRGPVTVTSAGGGSWTGNLQLEVLPFKLQPAERIVGMYWRGERPPQDVADAQIRDMLAHGVTAVTVDIAPKFSNDNGKLVVDTTKLAEHLRRLRSLGITGPAPLASNYTGQIKGLFPQGDQDALYVQAIAEVEKISNKPDTLKVLYYPVDEIGNDDKRGEVAHHLCELTAKVPGTTSYITVNNYKAGEKWGDTFDIWCGNIEYTAEQEQQLLARGKRYFRYGSAYLNDCRKARNTSGFAFYRRPAEAMYYWHYQAIVGDPENDFDGGSRDWCAAYPGPNGECIPTMDWESIREGIDDLKYIATLKALIAKAEQGTSAQKQAAAKARQDLDAILATDAGNVNQYTWAESLTHEEYNNFRRRLADRIIELMPK